MIVRRIVSIFVAVAAILSVILSSPLPAATVKLEAEAFASSNNIAYDPIIVSPELTCSGGLMITGLDCYNEWVEFDAEITVAGDYDVYMHCRGDLGAAYWFHLTMTPKGGGLVNTYTLNFLGKGYG